MDYSIRHIPAAGRFETQVEGYTGYVEYALLPQGVMDIRHTIVPKEIRSEEHTSELQSH